MKSPNLRALRAAAKLPICVGPFRQSTTGAIVPFFNDSRMLYSYPEVLKVFVDELAKIIKDHQQKHRIDLIVGVPMAGIPLAMALSLKTKIPFAYLNKERKKTLRKRFVEGDYQVGAHAVLVDDVVGLGGTFLKAIRDCARDGVVVKHIMTMWNPWHNRNRKFIANLEKTGVSYDTLYTRYDWIDYLVSRKILSPEVIEIQKAYLDDPTGWQKDRVMWRKFLAWKRGYKKAKSIGCFTH